MQFKTLIWISLLNFKYKLSSQFHYDFGMRALKAILNAAGELRRKVEDSEDILALTVLQDVNLPKFTLNDIPLF